MNDDDEVNDIVKIDNKTFQVNGRVLLDDLTEEFGIEFDDIDTIGGWLQSRNTSLQKMITWIQLMIAGLFQKSITTKLFG